MQRITNIDISSGLTGRFLSGSKEIGKSYLQKLRAYEGKDILLDDNKIDAQIDRFFELDINSVVVDN